jgi:alanine-synthesizing transaminase
MLAFTLLHIDFQRIARQGEANAQILYKRKYDVDFLDPNKHVCATMGSKEGYVHLVQAIVNVGDVAVVPDPTYPIHSYAFMLNGAAVHKFELAFDDVFKVDEDLFFERLQKTLDESIPKVKFVVVNFPHNPTCFLRHGLLL